MFWILRELCRPYLSAAVSRHTVLDSTLHNVAILGDVEWCRVEGGAEVDAKDRRERTALMYAAHFGVNKPCSCW